jgi:hypothetical protein
MGFPPHWRRSIKKFFGPLACLVLALQLGCENPSSSDLVKNSDAVILGFSIAETVGAISGTDIALWLPQETDKTSLSPEIVLSQGATVDPLSGSPRDFSAPLTYTVTAEDGSVQSYTVRVSSEDALWPPPFDSLASLGAYLSDFAGQNNRQTPVRVVFTDAVGLADFTAPSHNAAGDDPLGALYDALNGKYVSLDLSACAGTVLEDSQADVFLARHNRGNVTGLVLPQGLTHLGEYAFYSCYSLEECVVPPSLAEIGAYAFSGCTSLETINLEDAVAIGVLENYVFEDCTSLASIAFPAELTSIATGVFQNCAGLTSIVLPEGVTSIGVAAFRGCTGLRSIALPQSLASIEGHFYYGGAFQGCVSLTAVELPANVASLGPSAFQDCASLSSITLPEGLVFIGMRAFENCESLASIVLPATVSDISSNLFSGSGLSSLTLKNDGVVYVRQADLKNTPLGTGSIYVPQDLLDAYKAASMWSDYAANFKPIL